MEKADYLNQTQDSIEEFSSKRNNVQQYESEISVSRSVFTIQSQSNFNTPESTTVFDRLFVDFTRRQVARAKLSQILDLKKKQARSLSLHIPNFTEKKLNRRLKSSEFNQLISRLNDFWQKKWKNIETRKKEIAQKEEEEFRKYSEMKKKGKKSDQGVFNRLIKIRDAKVTEEKKGEKKVFSIKEAIESGKRLMRKRYSLMDIVPTPCISPIWTARSMESIGDGACKEKLGNIDDIFNRCKQLALKNKFCGFRDIYK